jgi:osmotically-inducible protein OsmY
MIRNRALISLALLVVLALTGACSLNRQTPEALDEEAMLTEVRAAIAGAVPGKTFDLGVDVTEGGRVKLTGNVDSSADRDAIVAKVRGISGVASVDASGLTVR